MTYAVNKTRYLKVICLYRPPKVTKDNKYGEKEYLFTEIWTIILIQVSIGSETVKVCQYIVLGMYTNCYNKCFVTDEKIGTLKWKKNRKINTTFQQ